MSLVQAEKSKLNGEREIDRRFDDLFRLDNTFKIAVSGLARRPRLSVLKRFAPPESPREKVKRGAVEVANYINGHPLIFRAMRPDIETARFSFSSSKEDEPYLNLAVAAMKRTNLPWGWRVKEEMSSLEKEPIVAGYGNSAHGNQELGIPYVYLERVSPGVSQEPAAEEVTNLTVLSSLPPKQPAILAPSTDLQEAA